MTPFQQGYRAAELNALTATDNLNPYVIGFLEYEQWEQGWQHWINEQWQKLLNEQAQDFMNDDGEINPQLPLDF